MIESLKGLELMSDFESFEKAELEDHYRCDYLIEVGGAENLELALILESCDGDQHLCKSSACKRCNREFRIQKVNVLVDKLHQDPRDWLVMTIIFYEDSFLHNEIESFDIRLVKDKLRKMLARSGFNEPVMGCFEMDYHQSCGLWLPHFHLVCPRNEPAIKELRNKLSKQQPKHIKKYLKPRPLKLQDIKNPYRQVSYIYKLSFMKVVDYQSAHIDRIFTKKCRLDKVLFCDSLRKIHDVGRRGIQFSFKERGFK